MTTEEGTRRGATWLLLACAAIGVTLGILVSVTTDLPLAPEAGFVLGLVVGWFVRLHR